MLKSLCLQTFMLAIYAAPYTQHSHPLPNSYSSSGLSANVTYPRMPSKTCENRLSFVPVITGPPLQSTWSPLTAAAFYKDTFWVTSVYPLHLQGQHHSVT